MLFYGVTVVYISIEEFSVLEHRAAVVKAQVKLRKHWTEQNQRKLEEALEQMDTRSRRVVMRAMDGKDIAHHQFDLSAVEFRDIHCDFAGSS